jgi:hypothetical protein
MFDARCKSCRAALDWTTDGGCPYMNQGFLLVSGCRELRWRRHNSCYSRNFPSVTFSLQRAELLLCWLQRIWPYKGKL